jgi:hypothetical protein
MVFHEPELRMVSLRQESRGKEEGTRTLKSLVETLREQGRGIGIIDSLL